MLVLQSTYLYLIRQVFLALSQKHLARATVCWTQSKRFRKCVPNKMFFFISQSEHLKYPQQGSLDKGPRGGTEPVGRHALSRGSSTGASTLGVHF